MSLLEVFGLNSHLKNIFKPFKEKGLEAGRVVSLKGFKHLVVSEKGEIECELSGSLINSKEQWELPKIGDWVILVPMEGSGYIIEVLERHTELSRKLPGKAQIKQVLVANVDYALIVQGLDQDFNLMRLQRYLQQVFENNVSPIVILNKSDLVPNPELFLEKVKDLGYDVPIYLTSAVTNKGLYDLENTIMQPGKTYVLLGSSGVGKSSILNSLMKTEKQITNYLSDANKKGKHTTTFRYLISLTNGALLIDTPGMREFGLISEDSNENIIHPKIKVLSQHCKFPDCNHASEPDCAVMEAVRNGMLPEIVYNSFIKLRKEQERSSIAPWNKKKNRKEPGKISRAAQSYKRKW